MIGPTGDGPSWSGFVGCIVCRTGSVHNEAGLFNDERFAELHIERGLLRIRSALAPMYDVQDVFVCNDECKHRYITETGPRHLRLMREGRAKMGLEVL